MPYKIFRNCHLEPNNIFGFSPLAPNKIFGFSLLAPNKICPSTFPLTTDRMIWFYFLKKVLVLCKRAVYLFVENWILYKMVKQHLDSTNSIPYKNYRNKFVAKKILNKLLAKCIIQILMPNLYSFCYMFIYKCILQYI